MSSVSTWQGATIAIVVYCLLASTSLVRAAQGQDDGIARDVALPLAKGIDAVADTLYLNRPYLIASRALGRDDAQQEPTVEFPPVTQVPLTASATTTTVPPLPVISPARPLRMSVFGDSLAIGLGKVLQQRTGTDSSINVDYDGRISSGLARQDFWNWPARIVEQLAASDADVVVVQFGANDDKPLTLPDGSREAAYGTPEWDAGYRRRIAGVMDLLNNQRRRVVWVGEPAMRRSDLDSLLVKIDQWVAEEAASRPWVIALPTRKLIGGPNGEYVDYRTPADGSPAIRCRAKDGIHPTTECDEIIADEILAKVRPIYSVAIATVPPSTVPPSTVPPSTTPAPAAGAATASTR